jgi:hypothetical protein
VRRGSVKIDVAAKGKIHLEIIRGDSDSLKIQLREKNAAGAWILNGGE